MPFLSLDKDTVGSGAKDFITRMVLNFSLSSVRHMLSTWYPICRKVPYRYVVKAQLCSKNNKFCPLRHNLVVPTVIPSVIHTT